MQPMYYIGLDVHKQKISYCVKDNSSSGFPRWIVGFTSLVEARENAAKVQNNNGSKNLRQSG